MGEKISQIYGELKSVGSHFWVREYTKNIPENKLLNAVLVLVVIITAPNNGRVLKNSYKSLSLYSIGKIMS